MDAGTAAFYDAYAGAGAHTEAQHSAMLPTLQAWLTPGATVLDVGAGAGRDLAALLALGFDAYGVEPHAGMRDTACQRHPALAGRLRDAALPLPDRPFADRCPAGFDAVVCSAVLMHVPPPVLAAALQSLAGALRASASPAPPVLLLSLPEMAAQRLRGSRDEDGRRFHNHAPGEVAVQLATHGLALAERTVNEAVLATTGTRWHTLVFQRA